MSPRNDVAAAAMNGVELVASWLTPAVLFCVLNVMIGTIFFTSSLKRPQPEKESKDQQQPPRLVRVSSFLERVKAFNLSSYQSPEAREEEEPDHVPDAVANAFNLTSYRSLQPDPAARGAEERHHVARSKSDAVANTFDISSYQSQAAALEEEEHRHLARIEPDAEANGFNLTSYRSLRPDPAAREEEEPHHVSRSKSDAVANMFHISSYQSPAAAPEEEEHHHVARSKPDAAANAFNLTSYLSLQPDPAAREEEEHHHVARSKSDEVANTFDLSSEQSPQPEPPARELQHVARRKSDAVVKALHKSASEKISMEKEEEEDEDEERWRPSTVRERTGGDEEVDGKADDFINKFRQQLKLQRMDSNLRYDEMLNRGAGR